MTFFYKLKKEVMLMNNLKISITINTKIINLFSFVLNLLSYNVGPAIALCR